MSSKEIISAIKQLCYSLEYKTSEIVCYRNKSSFGSNVMYKLKINAEGIRKMGTDLLNLEKKFGRQISLWKKEKIFLIDGRKLLEKKQLRI